MGGGVLPACEAEEAWVSDGFVLSDSLGLGRLGLGFMV